MQQDFHKINVSTYLFYILFGGWWRVKRDTVFLSSLTCASYMLTFKFRHVKLGGFYNSAIWVLDYDGLSDLMVDKKGILMHLFLYDIL